MENVNQFEQAALDAPPVAKKPRGRPEKPLDPLKVKSFMAALQSGNVSSSHLSQVTGFSKAEVMSMLKKMIKNGTVVKIGVKKGSKYNISP